MFDKNKLFTFTRPTGVRNKRKYVYFDAIAEKPHKNQKATTLILA
jgi:hypothetical protein